MLALGERDEEAVREHYAHTNAGLALESVERLAADMADTDNPIEVRSLGRTLPGSTRSPRGTAHR